MATDRQMRTVLIDDAIVQKGDYWEVPYTLITWDAPNDIDLTPRIENFIMHIKISFEPGLRDTRGGARFDTAKYLRRGGDPATIFKFRVEEVK